MIRYAQGDMFDTPANIRINTVNCVGVMGAGVALAFKNRYPEMFKAYAKACKAGEVRPGKPHLWEKSEFDEQVTVVNLPTKDHWRDPSEYEYIEKGLAWLKDFIAGQGKVCVTIPALGCGHGGLEWKRVQPMIESALEELPADIVIFGPSSSRAAGERIDDVTLAQLAELGIKRLCPGDAGYPEGLRGRSDATVYLKGDAEVLSGPILSVLPSVKPTDREIEGIVACVREITSPTTCCVLAGYSAKADRPVIRAALEQGAHVIICLVEGILQFSVRRDLKDVWDENRVTVISTAKPHDKWYKGGIGKATAVKLTLGGAAIVSDPAPSWLDGFARNGNSGMRSNLFFLNYGDMDDNVKRTLLQLGATPLNRNRESGNPNVAAVLAALASPK